MLDFLLRKNPPEKISISICCVLHVVLSSRDNRVASLV